MIRNAETSRLYGELLLPSWFALETDRSMRGFLLPNTLSQCHRERSGNHELLSAAIIGVTLSGRARLYQPPHSQDRWEGLIDFLSRTLWIALRFQVTLGCRMAPPPSPLPSARCRFPPDRTSERAFDHQSALGSSLMIIIHMQPGMSARREHENSATSAWQLYSGFHSTCRLSAGH